MKTISKPFFFLILFLFRKDLSFAQKEYVFVSTGQQKLLINPALAGNSAGLNIQTLGAVGNNGLKDYFSTYAGVDAGIGSWGLGLSRSDFNNKDGLYKANQTDFSVNYKIKLGTRVNLIPALQVSYLEGQLDESRIPFYYQIDWAAPYKADYTGVMDFRSVIFSPGLALDLNKRVSLGLTVFDPLQTGSNQFISHQYHLSVTLLKNKKIGLQPYAILKLQAFGKKYYEMGTYASYKIISLHAGFRTGYGLEAESAFSTPETSADFLIVGLKISYKNINLGYTLGTWTDLKIDSKHEFFLSLSLFNKDKKNKSGLMIN
jgi:hypothetical protein